jgi:hypothetical protein
LHDPTYGTGGEMLLVVGGYLHRINADLEIFHFEQEANDLMFAICKAVKETMQIKLNAGMCFRRICFQMLKMKMRQ